MNAGDYELSSSQLPLTETIFYVLLSFLEPSYGYVAMKKIEEVSNGEVRVAAGTMYGAIEKLVKSNLIEQISSAEERRKIYQTTDVGRDLLGKDVERMRHMINLWDKME